MKYQVLFSMKKKIFKMLYAAVVIILQGIVSLMVLLIQYDSNVWLLTSWTKNKGHFKNIFLLEN